MYNVTFLFFPDLLCSNPDCNHWTVIESEVSLGICHVECRLSANANFRVFFKKGGKKRKTADCTLSLTFVQWDLANLDTDSDSMEALIPGHNSMMMEFSDVNYLTTNPHNKRIRKSKQLKTNLFRRLCSRTQKPKLTTIKPSFYSKEVNSLDKLEFSHWYTRDEMFDINSDEIRVTIELHLILWQSLYWTALDTITVTCIWPQHWISPCNEQLTSAAK